MRVSGKHNDLENVGRTPRHHTFFEMLGNFSFGDYFKRDAIVWAWELVTKTWGIPPEKLSVTVFREDDEAAELWAREVGLPAHRITRLDEADNFWQMGDTGPCGPCSEIYFDWGPQPGCPKAPTDCDPSCECGRWLEIWNLVFMQFDRDASGAMTPLPKPSIDTGAGLERVASVLQGVRSNYDTDLFRSILARAQELSGVQLGTDPEKDVSLRVVADHARAVTFLVGDGVLPSNEGRGYVLRRILRRAARHGVLLGVEGPFLHSVADAVIDEMGDAYPDLVARRDYITSRVRREEERFGETLSKGLALLEEEVRKAKAAKLAQAARRRRLQALRHLRISRRSHRGHPRRACARLRHRRLRRRDDRTARARARGVEGKRTGGRRLALLAARQRLRESFRRLRRTRSRIARAGAGGEERPGAVRQREARPSR